jgi:DNA gyrase/topoisomerase IV subunit A
LLRDKNYSLENAAERLLIVHAYLKADCMVEAVINCDKNDKKERNLRSFVINNFAHSNFYAAWSGFAHDNNPDDNKKERRARQVRITERTYNELAKLGNVTDDFEDVIARLLKHYKETATKK